MIRVYTSSVIDASADTVWSRIRDFNGLPQWHPGIADSRIENDEPSDRVGCIRHFHTRDGGMIRERLLALSDYDYSCIYEILESPMGVENYVATLKLTPVTDGARCFAEWSAEFDCAEARERELVETIGERVFQGGFDALKRALLAALSAPMLQHVVRSTVIDAPIERVWAVLRDFNSHDRWHDVVAESRIEGDERSDQVGCVRSFTLKDGNRIREQLLALSDSEHKSTYCIVEATVPLQRYVATVTLKPVTDGDRTFWHWESTFATPPGRERELREMVARDVYEAGFANLRRHLREGGDRRGAGAAAMPTRAAAAVAPRRRAPLRRPRGAAARRRRGAGAAEPARCASASARSASTSSTSTCAGAGSRRCCRCPACRAWRRPARVVDVGAGVSGFLPGDRVAYLGPAPGAYCSVRTVPADWVVRLPAAIDDDVAAATLLKGITADFLLRDLGHVGAGTRLLVHAAAGGVGLLVCAWARRLGADRDRHRLERREGAGRARARLRASDRDARLSLRRRRAGAVRRRRRRRRRPRRRRARRELRGARAPRPLDQPRPGERRRCSRSRPTSWCSKSITFSRPVVFDYVATNAHLAERAQRVWAALADGTLKAPPIERHSLDAAAEAHARLESRRTIGALVLIA